jgi:hypothetical protein
MANSGKKVFVQFAKARSIHRGFSKWKMKHDNQKKFIPPLALHSEFLHRTFAILIQSKTKGQVGALCACTVQDGAVTLEGSHRMGGRQIFIKNYATLSLIMAFRMNLILAGSIPLDSTFNLWIQNEYMQYLGIKPL